VGLKSVALSEDMLHDHFPGNPVLPGIFVIEGLAQTGGVLLHESTDGRRFAVMVSIDRARFASFARPGETVRLLVEAEEIGEDTARVKGTATVDGREIAAARISFRLLPLDAVIAPAYHFAWQQTLNVWLGRYPESPHA